MIGVIGLFKVYSLDDGSLVVVCGKCGYHLVITKDVLDRARKSTVCGETENFEEEDVRCA